MLIALDAGHGGSDPGAVYNGRREKDDNLRLAMAVGDILKNEGMDVFYTRDNDIYETPFKKATDANNSGADYFVSFHRNSGENPNAASGVQVLIYSEGGEKEHLAENILDNLTDLGFKDLGIIERPNLVVLKRTNMPAVLIETGFISINSYQVIPRVIYEEMDNNGVLEDIEPQINGNDMEAKILGKNKLMQYVVSVSKRMNYYSANEYMDKLDIKLTPQDYEFDEDTLKGRGLLDEEEGIYMV